MIKALRRKFILVNMLLVFFVLLVVFTTFCVSSYRRAAEENRVILQRGLNWGDRQRPVPYRVGRRSGDQRFEDQRSPADFD
jgi:hypothetical protein